MIRQLLTEQQDRDKIALIEADTLVTYGMLLSRAAAVQNRLSGIRSKHIAIYLPNGADYMAAFWGTLMAGMAAFPLNVLLTGHEVAPLLAQASVHTVITSEKYRSLMEEAAMTAAAPLDIVCVEELDPYEGDLNFSSVSVDAGETMVLLTTSGTTGKAKIVELTERNVESCALAFIDKVNYEEYHQDEVRLILGTPFSTVYGIMIQSVCLIRSYPLVVLTEAFTLDMFYRAVEAHLVTHYEGGPNVALLMEQTAGRPIPYNISSLKYVGFGGSKTTAATFRKLKQAYPEVLFWPGYGMTEASPLIAKPYKKMNMDKLESVGTAVNGMTIMVVTDAGITNAPYLSGEIIVKGPNVMKGYYNNDEETRKILKNGYLYTGDIGYLDEDGALYISGRKKNVIMAQGFSVYAEEVEACIQDSGLVKDCVVYGETDRQGNETVCADIVPMSPEVQAGQVHGYCKIHLTGYKQPRNIRVVEEIRKTANHKTERGGRKGQ